MSTILYRRTARRPPPAMPKGEVLFEAPPELPEVTAGSQMQKIFSILPMLGGVGGMAFMFGGGTNNGTMRMMSSVMMMLSMSGMFFQNIGGKGGERKQQIDGSRRDYLRYLTQLRRRIRTAANRQREALEFRYPDPDSLWALPLSRRLWERRPNDKDFSHVRLARGSQQFLLKLIAPETKPVEDLEPVAAGALRRFIQTYRTVPDVPVSVALRGFAHVRLEGEAEHARGLSRAMIGHLAAFHAPHEMVIAFCIGPDRRADWDWVKWLPHNLHPSKTDGAGNIRFMASSMSDLERMLSEQLAGRPFFNAAGNPLTDQPHVVVIIDGGHTAHDSRLLTGPAQGVTVIDLGGQAIRRAGEGVLWLQVDEDNLVYVTPTPDGISERRTELGKPDVLDVVQIESFARQLAPLRSAVAAGVADVEEEEAVQEKPQHELELMSLLGIDDATNLDPEVIWKPRPNRDRLRVPFGLTSEGEPIELDIKESAQGGMGPHGLLVGATGSGKSEVLRTVVLGLVTVHSPDALNLVLVDFKGGATFMGLNKLPHVSAVITNLEGELTLVDRMRDAIMGELNRRQEVLRQAGNLGSLRDYEESRLKGGVDLDGKPLEPLPSLWIVCDEFSELLAAKPEFIEDFIAIGRIGRSLGVHMLLASQRLEEGKLRGLDTFLSYRIGLRTFSAGESRIVLGVPDAFELPRAPGNGYLKVAQEPLIRFTAAYVGSVYRRPTQSGSTGPSRPKAKPGERVWMPQITAYTTDYVEPNIVEVPAEPEPEVAQETQVRPDQPENEKVLVDLVVDQLIGKGRPAHEVWLPPLNEPPTINQLLPPLEINDQLGLHANWEGRGRLQVPVAICDRPYYQRRDPYWIDVSGAAGHIGIAGSPQSGKSTMLRTIITSFALTHTPQEVQFYALDFGGGTLPGMLGLPHLGGVATRLDTDGIRRTIGELTALLDQRERMFTENGIDSIATYRRLRRDGRIQPDRFAPDVFLIVDGWATVRSDHEAVEAAVTELAARGLGFGIHIIATAIKWGEFRIAIKELFQTKIELKLGDAYDSEVDRRVAVNVPGSRPGRGISPDKLHFLGALPRIDNVEDAEDLADGVRAMIDQVNAAWKGQPAPPVRLLPERLQLSEVPAPGADTQPGIPIGIDEDELLPVYLRIEEEPHLFITGLNECGKSNLLEVIAKGIMARKTPKEARIIMIDYRRSLIDAAVGDHMLGYAASSDTAASMVKDAAAALKKRQPGPNVTPEQLKTRSWWTGSELYIIVDDYDLVATSSGNPLQPLADLVSQATDVGLHIILARGFGGVSRASFDPIIQRMKDTGNPAIIMSGNREEGKLWGNYVPVPMPPGRGALLSRRLGQKLIQTVYMPKPEDEAAA